MTKVCREYPAIDVLAVCYGFMLCGNSRVLGRMVPVIGVISLECDRF